MPPQHHLAAVPWDLHDGTRTVPTRRNAHALGVQPGFVTVQTLVNDHVEIRFYPPEHTRSLRGALKKYATRTLSTDELREAREKAWDEAVTTDWREGGDR